MILVDVPISSLKCCSINVCGLKRKLSCPDFVDYVNQFDIVCIQETKLCNLDSVELDGFELHCNNRGGIEGRIPSGGVGILISDKVKDKVKVLKPTHDHVLWCVIDKSVLHHPSDILLGNVYIPPEKSKYSNIEMFSEIEEEMIDICHLFNCYNNCILSGDFNSHFGSLSEVLQFDDVAHDNNIGEIIANVLPDEISITEFGISENRKSQEKTPYNNYGYRFVEMCKNLGMFVLNGRVGRDKDIGSVTCNRSVDDVFSASPIIFSLVKDFYVDTFNPLLSDKHSPICLSLTKPVMDSKGEFLTENTECEDQSVVADERPPAWRSDLVDTFMENIDVEFIEEIETSLDNLENLANINNEDLDIEVEKIAKLFKNASENAFPSRRKVQYKGKNIKRKAHKHKEWFDEDCKMARKSFCKAHNNFRKLKSAKNFEIMKSSSRGYKKVMSKCRRKHKKVMEQKIRNLKSKNPKEYWQMINPKNKKAGDIFQNISMEALQEHFKKLNECPSDHANGIDDLIINFDHDIEGLNGKIEIDEVKKVIHGLKNGKAQGLDYISNEQIKASEHLMLNIYCKLFNLVLDKGIVPSSWTLGVIQALYKNKGDPKDADNYRGITLLSCLGKVFTAVLNNRLGKFAESVDLIHKEQAGFRPGCSTVDHMFALNCLLEIYLSKGMKLYCGFVDYRKAFDSVWRLGLWKKLLDENINGKIVKVIMKMYENAKSCVRGPSNIKETFSCQIGVRQGENLSPFLFAVYLNDLSSFLENSGATGLEHLHQYSTCDFVRNLGFRLKLFVLLYADDTILLSDSAKGLQQGLDLLGKYCDQWKLSVNGTKTKVVIFSRGKSRKKQDPFFYMGTELEIVDDYTYLGIVFNYNGSFSKARKKRYDQASRAMFGLLRHCRKLELPFDISLELFDRMISPILLYGCELWGFEDITILERLHLKFCKLLLRVSKFTPSCMIYYELGRFPVKHCVQERMVMFWGKLLSPDGQDKWCNLLYKVVYDLHKNGYLHSKWCSFVEDSLNTCGLGYLWLGQTPVNIKWLKTVVKQSLQDQYRQTIFNDILEHPKCVNYRIFCNREKFQIQKYLLDLPDVLVKPLCNYRLGCNKLPGVIGRNQNLDNQDWYCKLCDNEKPGDELHYLLECPVFKKSRAQYLGNYFCHHPNVLKFEKAMCPQSISKLRNLAYFCKTILHSVYATP